MGDVRLRFTRVLLSAGFAVLAGAPCEGRPGIVAPLLSGASQRTEISYPSFTGTVHSFDGKILTLDRGDSNNLDFHCSRKTRYFDGERKVDPSAIKPGLPVMVEGKQAPDASLDAVTVRLVKDQPGPQN